MTGSMSVSDKPIKIVDLICLVSILPIEKLRSKTIVMTQLTHLVRIILKGCAQIQTVLRKMLSWDC